MPNGRQRVRAVLTTDGQQGSTDEGDESDDCTEVRRSVIDRIRGSEFIADYRRRNATQRTSSEVFTQYQYGDGSLYPK